MGVTYYNHLSVATRLCCYIEQLEKINVELNLRKNEGKAGAAISGLVTDFLSQIHSDPNFVVDSCQPDQFLEVPADCEPEPEAEPVQNLLSCVFGVYLVREDGTRFRLFDKQALAYEMGVGEHTLDELKDPNADLIPSDPQNVTYSEVVCCLKNHFELVKKHLTCAH